MIDSVRAVIKVPCEKRFYEIISSSLRPEIEDNINRSSVHIEIDETGISLDIEAHDISSMRAGVNSYMRWIDTSFKIYSGVR